MLKKILKFIKYQFYHRKAYFYVWLFAKDKITFAQNKEDLIIDILTGFKDNGTYIDVGANHPSIISNTKKFYDRGWNGINIEPKYENYLIFIQERNRDINLNIGIAKSDGEMDFYYKSGGNITDSTGSTFSKEVYNERSYDFPSKKIKVLPLSKIFEDNGLKTVDFINIDVEGFELEILEGNDWRKYKANVLCIEGQGYDEFLKKFGYDKVFFDGANSYYKLKN